MNLSAYDTVKVNKTSTYINTENKCLVTNEIPFYKYYSLAKRYNKEENCYDIYIIFSNKAEENIVWNTVYFRSNKVKINLRHIWNNINIDANNWFVDVKLIKDDEDDDGCIYKLEL